MDEIKRNQFIKVLTALYLLPAVGDTILLTRGWPMDLTDDFKENVILISVRLEFLLGLVTYLSFYFSKKEKAHSFLWILGFINALVGVLTNMPLFFRLFYIDKESILIFGVLYVSFVFIYMVAIGYCNYSLYVYDQTRGK